MTVWSSEIIAAVGEPVGQNANWSDNVRVGGGVRNAGYRKWRTTDLSMTLVRTGVMEMGRNCRRVARGLKLWELVGCKCATIAGGLWR